MTNAIGIDIGGTSTKLALLDKKGEILHRSSFETAESQSANQYLGILSTHIELSLEKVDSNSVCGIGIGAPSSFPGIGVIKNAVNLSFSDNIEIVSFLKKRFSLPVYLTNDGHAAAIGEGMFGAAQPYPSYLIITLGTGLGCGIVFNGQVLAGRSGQAAEIGHAVIQENGRRCSCGKRGCLETYVSATGIKRTYIHLLSDSNQWSVLQEKPVGSISAKNVYEAANEGDELASEAFAITGKLLGRKLAELSMIFEPDAIILAGGLAEAGDHLFKPAIQQMESELLEPYKNRIKVLASSLKVNDAGLLGAGSLAFKNINVKEACFQL